MRLISYRHDAVGDALGVVESDRWTPARALLPGGPATMADLLREGPPALEALRAAAVTGRIADDGRPLDEIELLAPVPRPGKIVAIGRNYREHVDEEGTEAAAATAAVLTARMALSRPDPAPIPIFRADHPFLFAIRDRKSGAIIFLGRVADPARES